MGLNAQRPDLLRSGLWTLWRNSFTTKPIIGGMARINKPISRPVLRTMNKGARSGLSHQSTFFGNRLVTQRMGLIAIVAGMTM
ncbi:hypothetical protein AY555_05480 [Haematospirillum jordaniae]|uniref:Uncharacterized protein n=1 Tax=Haematospirillum jordaniae TaxID=1549855 RepID=A0A143DD90_9PROT|nr:hypothetical protein AY555_05480 [Haematospirillum jordaniae]